MADNTTAFSLASEATIQIDSDEVSSFLGNESANKLTIDNQDIEVNSAATRSPWHLRISFLVPHPEQSQLPLIQMKL